MRRREFMTPNLLTNVNQKRSTVVVFCEGNAATVGRASASPRCHFVFMSASTG
jgi:hypothetical protein